MTVQVWDIGLRPLFPVLRKMVAQIDRDTLTPIKLEWVGIFEKFLRPLFEMDGDSDRSIEPGFHCFTVARRGG
jgi:hypothetical protein